MTKLQERAQGQVKQMVGQMIGDDRLVSEGREQLEQTERKQPLANEQKDRKKKAAPSKEKTRDQAKR